MKHDARFSFRGNWVRIMEALLVGYVGLVFVLEVRLLANLNVAMEVPSQKPAVAVVWKVGATGSNPGEIQAPLGMAVDAAINLYVADRGNHRVQKYLASGVVDAEWSGDTSGQHPFIEPSGIAVNPKDQSVWIMDSGNGWVYRLDPSGELEAKIDGVNFGLYSPRGIAVSETGGLYISDTGSGRIVHLSQSGEIVSTWGSPGNGRDQLRDPTGIVIAEDEIIVADAGNHRIVSFDFDGNWKSAWKVNPGCAWIAEDDAGRIFVSDTQQNNILIFDRSGRKLVDFSAEKAILLLDTPTGIAVAPGGRVFVIGDNQISQFTIDWSKA
jgi:tripartite motif-containing protein 71